MINKELRDEWAEVACKLCLDKNGRDITPSLDSTKKYLGFLFKRKAFNHITDDISGQSSNQIVEALDRDSDKCGYAYAVEAAASLEALKAHIVGDVTISRMKLTIFNG